METTGVIGVIQEFYRALLGPRRPLQCERQLEARESRQSHFCQTKARFFLGNSLGFGVLFFWGAGATG